MLEKKWFQHIMALVVFLLVSVIFCKPVLEKKILMAGDNFQTIGSLKEADANVHNTDAKTTGWTGTMFSGMPVFRSVYPNKLVGLVYSLKQAPHAHSYDVLLWLMFSFYLLCLSLGISPWIAILCSIGYAFTAFNIMSMEGGHFMKIFASAMIPGTLGGIIFLLKGKWLPGAMTFFLFINLLVGINHTQLTYYAMIIGMITGIYFSFDLLLKKKFGVLAKAYGIIAIGLGLSIASNIGVFHNLSTAEATTRGGKSELSSKQEAGSGLDKEYASSWSMDRIEIFTYFIPNFAGGPSSKKPAYDKNSKTRKALATKSKNNQQANQLADSTSAYWGNQRFVGGGFYNGCGICFPLLALYSYRVQKCKNRQIILAECSHFLVSYL